MTPEKTCLICGEVDGAADERLLQPCGVCCQSWCMKCILNRCELATKSLGEMPAQCCTGFDPRLVLKALPEAQHDHFKNLFDEYRTEAKDRVYCPTRDCGVFISPYNINKSQQQATSMDCTLTSIELANANHKRHDSGVTTPNIHKVECHKCNTTICLTCKQVVHDGSPCQMEDDPILAQIQKFGYKRCPRCGYGTRRMWGCNHMQCVCGAHWCWNCERNFAICDAMGGCGDDAEDSEDDDLSEDETEDQDQILEETTELRAVTDQEVNSDSAGGKHTEEVVVGEASGTAGQGAGESTEEHVTRRRRSINLDRGSHAFWEGEGLDFGNEPDSYENDGVWGCKHGFDTKSKRDEDNLGKQVCWDCWSTVEGECSRCYLCKLVRCADCLELLGAGKEDY